MVNKISNNLARYLSKKDIVKEEDVPIYAFGFEALFASIFGTLLIAVIGCLLNQGVNTLVFIIIFALTRSYSGGYHAKSHLTCNMSVAVVYLATILLTEAIVYSNMVNAVVLFILFYLSVMLKFAPVPNSHKRMSVAESKEFREKVLILSAIWIIAALIFIYVKIRIAITISVTLLAIAVLILIQQYMIKEGGDSYE